MNIMEVQNRRYNHIHTQHLKEEESNTMFYYRSEKYCLNICRIEDYKVMNYLIYQLHNKHRDHHQSMDMKNPELLAVFEAQHAKPKPSSMAAFIVHVEQISTAVVFGQEVPAD